MKYIQVVQELFALQLWDLSSECGECGLPGKTRLRNDYYMSSGT